MKEVVIVSGTRTAIDDFGGPLKDVSCTELGKIVILEAIKRAGIEKEAVDEVIMGNVLPTGLGQNPARQATLLAEMPFDVGSITVNKVCGSGLKSVMLADQAIKAGDAEIIVAGGMENMYQAPYYLPAARGGYRLFDGKLVDGMVHDGLWDIQNDFHMGYTAENIAEQFNISREEQDNFAIGSYQKTRRAAADGKFKDEIVPVAIPQRRGDPVIFDTDEVPQKETSLEALARLRPAFKDGGTVTAGNASKISDGAAAVVVMSQEKANELGIAPMAKIVAQGAAGIDPNIVLMAPIHSIPKVLKKAGLELKDIDIQEINEAFSASTLGVIKELGIDQSTVNVKGGAVSQGHPIGASGAIRLVTLLYEMRERDARRGMVTLCLGGGEAVTMILER